MAGLGDLEKQLLAVEDRRKKREQKEEKQQNDREKAAEEIAKMKKEMEKDLDEVTQGLNQEKLAGMERLEDKLKARKQKKQELMK